jgi:hypothetical protein
VFKSNKSSLIILGLTAIVFSRAMFMFFDDPEGTNLLVTTGMTLIVYLLTFAVYVPNPLTVGLKKLLITIFIQILMVVALYFCLK